MKRPAGLLCVLGLLCLHSLVLLGQDLEDQPEVLVFCDAPAVEAAAKAAMSSFNQRVLTGSKMALYQILSASKGENSSGVVYSVKFNIRKSNCAAEDIRPWTDCGYLADDAKEPMLCNATVYVSEGESRTLAVDCNIEGPIVPERVACLGCPEEVDLESEDLKVPLISSISKYNAATDSTHLFMLNYVGFATRQVLAGLRYQLRFELTKSNCSKAEHTRLHLGCAPHGDEEMASCNSTVDIAGWRHEDPQVQLLCEPGQMTFSVTPRRRPPGWSPLRNIVEPPFKTLGPAAPPPTNAAPPAAKEESSEEEDGAKVTEGHPFRCPAGPWMTLLPVQSTTVHPDVATAERIFLDSDLAG